MPVERIAARGTWGTVEWALDARLRMAAREFFLALDPGDQRKVAALFQWLATEGRVPNREKFKGLGVQGAGLWEFKSHQVRFLGDFRPGARFVVALGLRKKQDALRPADVEAAARIMVENDAVEREEQAMTRAKTDYERIEGDPKQRALLRKEELILAVTNAIAAEMERQGVTRADLSRRLGRTRGHVTQFLGGGNLTLGSIAEIADALGCAFDVTLRPAGRAARKATVRRRTA